MLKKFVLAVALAAASLLAFAQPYYPSTGLGVGGSITTPCTTSNAVLYNASTPCSANLTFATAALTVGTSNGASQGFVIGNGGSGISRIFTTDDLSNWILSGSATSFTLRAISDITLATGAGATAKFSIVSTAGAGPSITAGTAASNAPRALSISQTWTDGTSSNIGIVGNFDMGATGTATGDLINLQAGTAGTTEKFAVRYDGMTRSTGFADTSAGFNTGTNSSFLLDSAFATRTDPTYASGGCTGGAGTVVTNANGTAYATVTNGTGCSGSQPIVLTFPTATTGWHCYARNVSNGATSAPAQTGAVSTTSVTITNFARTTGVAAAWTDSDVVVISCLGG